MGFPLVSALGALTVSLGTADTLAYLILALVATFLISSSLVSYIFYKKYQRQEAAAAPETTPSSPG